MYKKGLQVLLAPTRRWSAFWSALFVKDAPKTQKFVFAAQWVTYDTKG